MYGRALHNSPAKLIKTLPTTIKRLDVRFPVRAQQLLRAHRQVRHASFMDMGRRLVRQEPILTPIALFACVYFRPFQKPSFSYE